MLHVIPRLITTLLKSKVVHGPALVSARLKDVGVCLLALFSLLGNGYLSMSFSGNCEKGSGSGGCGDYFTGVEGVVREVDGVASALLAQLTFESLCTGEK